jgi:SecD/SecF fusion protein
VLGFLLIEDFKINMPIIAALLTIIGFSINDTIVIFDRVREVRGRLGIVTPQVVNRAINECMSRTILTTGTVLTVLLAMYTFGGTSIRGFTYCMLVGCISGVYSTVAIAGPLLLLGQEKPAPVRDAVPARA